MELSLPCDGELFDMKYQIAKAIAISIVPAYESLSTLEMLFLLHRGQLIEMSFPRGFQVYPQSLHLFCGRFVFRSM